MNDIAIIAKGFMDDLDNVADDKKNDLEIISVVSKMTSHSSHTFKWLIPHWSPRAKIYRFTTTSIRRILFCGTNKRSWCRDVSSLITANHATPCAKPNVRPNKLHANVPPSDSNSEFSPFQSNMDFSPKSLNSNISSSEKVRMFSAIFGLQIYLQLYMRSNLSFESVSHLNLFESFCFSFALKCFHHLSHNVPPLHLKSNLRSF